MESTIQSGKPITQLNCYLLLEQDSIIMNYEIKLATVVDTNTLSKKGIFQALLYKTNIQVPVVMTTPMGSHPTSIEYGTFAGLFGNPTLWTQVLIKKIDERYWDSIPVLPTLKSSIFPTLTNSQILVIQNLLLIPYYL